MENWGLVTYREVALLIDPTKSSTRQRSRVALVVAHELAHFWFGNLVTMVSPVLILGSVDVVRKQRILMRTW